MVLSLVWTPVYATGKLVVKAESDKGIVHKGDTFTISVKVGGTSEQIGAMQVKLVYDKTKVSFQSGNNGEFGEKFTSQKTVTDQDDGAETYVSGAYAVNDEALNNENESVLFTATFSVLVDEAGNITPELRVEDVYDGDYNSIGVDMVQTTVTITSATSNELPVTIAKPVTGGTPQGSITETADYTGTIAWEGSPSTFAASTEYTANVTLTAKGSYRFDNNVKPTVAGATSVTVESVADDGSTLTFNAKFSATGTATLKDILIPGLTVAVPTAKPNETQTKSTPIVVVGVYDDPNFNPTVAATLKITTDPIPDGVSLEGNILKVTNKAEACKVRVLATFEGKTDNKEITITKEESKATHIVATAPATGTNITIPNGGSISSGNCSYTVYDQYGAEKTGASATWKMEPETVQGVTFVPANGSFSVNNTATTCTVKLHAESGTLKSNEITFNIAREASVAKSLTIEGSADSVTVPTVSAPGATNSADVTYTATVKDQYGAVIPNPNVEWNVTDATGVSIDDNGKLTVTNKADAGPVTITATSGTLSATKTVTINKDTAKETFVKITAQDNEPPVTLIICTGSPRLEYYTATVYDQYGKEIQDEVTWSLDPAVSGVSYESPGTNNNNVTLTVAPDTAEGTFKLVATSKTVNTVKGDLEITVQKKTNVSDKINFANGSLTYNGKGQKHENAALGSSVTAGENSKWTYTYTVKGGTASLDGGLPKTVGTYNVTATYEDSLNVGSKTVELTIGPKEVTVSGITAENKEYNGNTDATVITSGATFDGKVDGDELTINATGTFANADVGDGKTVTLTLGALSGTSAGNYTLTTDGNQTTTTANITRRDLTVTPEPNQSKKFGEEDPTMLSFATANVVPNETTSFTGKLSRAEGEAVGQYDITQGTLEMTDDVSSGFKASNYTLNWSSTLVKFEIKKADALKLKDITVSQKYTVTTEQSKDIGRAGMPEKAGALAYAKGTESKTGSVKVDNWSVDSTTGKVSYKLSNGAADDTVTLPVTITSENYENSTVNVKITLTKPSYSGGGSYTPSYTVSVDKTENGTITVSPKSASKGDTVTITVKPDKGYELDTLKVLDKDGDKVKLTEKNGKYTFKMPSGKVTVKGSFVEEAPVQIFKDVPTDAYYYEAVKWAAEKGITGGVGNGLFAPNQPCTRAQIVTFLWRAAGSPAPKNMSSFADVPADAFYAKAVAWAVENGITGGTGDGKFSPDATCTRAQSVTFLYRAAGSPKVSSSAEFGDVATNAYYADAVAWAAKNGITGGIGGGLFGSNNDCTRAQIVTFLYNHI